MNPNLCVWVKKKIEKMIAGNSYTTSVIDNEGPPIPVWRHDLVPDARTGLDRKPRYRGGLLNSLTCGLYEMVRWRL